MRSCLAGMVTVAVVLAAQTPSPSVPEGPAGSRAIVYKQTKTRALSLHVLSPAGTAGGKRTAVVFFFGGGWTGGTVQQFAEQGRTFAARGRVSIFVDYRVRSRDESTPFESVADALDAMRWVRKHAAELNIDPDRIVAAGGSAGGHLAAATAILNNGDQSARPAALLLFNPVVDTTETGYGHKALGERARELSPVHHLQRGLPPAILFHGTKDRTVPFSNAEKFAAEMRALGNRCELVPFEGADHGFFNSPTFRSTNSKEVYETVLQGAEKFLTSLGL